MKKVYVIILVLTLVACSSSAEVSDENIILPPKMGNRGFLAGIKYSDTQILIALTEKRTKIEIDNYVESFSEVNNG